MLPVKEHRRSSTHSGSPTITPNGHPIGGMARISASTRLTQANQRGRPPKRIVDEGGGRQQRDREELDAAEERVAHVDERVDRCTDVSSLSNAA